MFIIVLTYKKSIEIIDSHLSDHRKYLDAGYKNNFFVASGPKQPRTGGVIISQLTDRKQLEDVLKQDPFSVNDLADYEIIEFTPIKYHPNFAQFVETT